MRELLNIKKISSTLIWQFFLREVAVYPHIKMNITENAQYIAAAFWAKKHPSVEPSKIQR